MDATTSRDTLADLRAFFTIGFQERWLGKQGIPREYLFMKLVTSCMEKGLGLVAITSEDDRMIEGSPEDRLGYLMKCPLEPPYSNMYSRERLDENLLRVKREEDGRTLLLLNSETVHAPQGKNWNGLKLHVLGANRLPKTHQTLEDAAKYFNDEGLLTFLTGITLESILASLLENPAKACYGIITHDASNVLSYLAGRIPFIGKSIQESMGVSNVSATLLARDLDKPGIAVSSAHFPHDMGRASILITDTYLDTEKVRTSSSVLACLRHVLDERAHVPVEGYNYLWDVLKFRYLLNKYDSDLN